MEFWRGDDVYSHNSFAVKPPTLTRPCRAVFEPGAPNFLGCLSAELFFLCTKVVCFVYLSLPILPFLFFWFQVFSRYGAPSVILVSTLCFAGVKRLLWANAMLWGLFFRRCFPMSDVCCCLRTWTLMLCFRLCVCVASGVETEFWQKLNNTHGSIVGAGGCLFLSLENQKWNKKIVPLPCPTPSSRVTKSCSFPPSCFERFSL